MHISKDTQFLIKKPETYTDTKTAFSTNVPVKLAELHVKNSNRYMLIILYKIQVQMDQRTQNKIQYTELDRREVGKNREVITLGNDCLSRTLLAQTLKPTINK